MYVCLVVVSSSLALRCHFLGARLGRHTLMSKVARYTETCRRESLHEQSSQDLQMFINIASCSIREYIWYFLLVPAFCLTVKRAVYAV